jgi:signal transduction histidine kinase
VIASLSITLLIFVMLIGATVWTIDAVSTTEAEREAAVIGEFNARVALSAYITDGLLDADPDSRAILAQAAAGLLAHSAVDHVKVWSRDGEILWSDDERLVGRQFALESSELELLESGGVSVEVSDLDRAENAFDTPSDGSHRLLEVYFVVHTEAGRPVLVETYFPYSLVSDRATAIRQRFLPVAVGGLALLALSQIPVTTALARRLGRSRREREQMFEQAIERGDLERRRIAAEVHDGAVQDLIGVSFALAGTAAAAPPGLAERIRALAGDTRRIVGSLRSLLDSIYPVKVPSTGWVDGLDDVLTPLRDRGIDVKLDVPHLELTPADEMLLLRVSREALRNASTHADPQHVDVSLTRKGGHLLLDIRDDGKGFDSSDAGCRHASGHLGLPLIIDLASDAGAQLSIESSPGHGTNVHLEVSSHA